MQVRPDMLRVRSETQRVQVKSHRIIVLTLESICNTQIHPHSHVVWSDVQSLMIVLNCLVSSSQVSQCRADLVHKQVIGWVERKRLVKQIDGNTVLSLDKEQNGHGAVNIRVILVEFNRLVKDIDEVLVHLLDVFDFKTYLVLNVLWNYIRVEFY